MNKFMKSMQSVEVEKKEDGTDFFFLLFLLFFLFYNFIQFIKFLPYYLNKRWFCYCDSLQKKYICQYSYVNSNLVGWWHFTWLILHCGNKLYQLFVWLIALIVKFLLELASSFFVVFIMNFICNFVWSLTKILWLS